MKKNRVIFPSFFAVFAIVAVPAVNAARLATWSDRFVDSIGINIAGCSQQDAVPLVQNLGIRFVRSGNIGKVPAWRGIGFTDYATGAHDGRLVVNEGTVTQQLQNIKSHNNPGQIIAVEGPDEYDVKHGTDPDWVGNLRTWDAEVGKQMRADPWFVGIPYIGASMGHAPAYSKLGDESAFTDAVNLHPYPGVAPGEQDGLNWLVAGQGNVSDGNVAWATETGYSTGKKNCSPTVQARYLPTMLLDLYNEGYVKTFIYDLADKTEDKSYDGSLGLYEYSAKTIKPAGTAVKNLIAILQDPRPKPFYAGALDFELKNAPADVRATLLEKSDGTFYLALWREIKAVDAVSDAAPVTLDVKTPVKPRAMIYTPNVSADATPANLSGGTITLNVTDQLQIIALTPSRSASLPPSPKKLHIEARSGQHRTTVSWATVDNADGYVIERFNPYGQWIMLGSTPADAGSFVDLSIVPGDTYGYRVTAVNRAGGSEPVSGQVAVPVAAFVDDSLDDFSHTTEAGPADWKIIPGGPNQCHDPHIAVRNSAGPASLTYHQNGLGDFIATVYEGNSPAGTTTFLASTDGQRFIPVKASTAKTTRSAGLGSLMFFRPVDALPAGTNYLRITLSGDRGGSKSISLGDLRLWSEMAR